MPKYPTRSDILFALKMVIMMLCAYSASKALGLAAPLWAGATAIIIAGETPGASLRAGLSRLLGTVIGVSAGLSMHLFFTRPLVLAATGFLTANLICAAFGLKRELKVAGVSSLLPTLVVQGLGIEPSLVMAARRTINILIGGAVGLALSYLLWPRRAADQLQLRIKEQVGHLGRLASDIVAGHAEGSLNATDLRQRLRYHEDAGGQRRALISEADMEPTRTDDRQKLELQIASLEQLVGVTAALLISVERAQNKPVPARYSEAYREFAAAVAASTETWGGPAWASARDRLISADEKITAELERPDEPPLTDSTRRQNVASMDIALWSHRLAVGLIHMAAIP
jgi:uncharacterized membrane protein YccC